MSKYLADKGAFETGFVNAEGCFLYDKNGKRYIDFLGGWCVSTVGWKHPEMMKIQNSDQDRGFYIPPSYTWPEWEKFARYLAQITPGELQISFRCTSGSEAVEFAMKIARATTGRKKIVSVEQVYHGHTFGAASLGNALTEAMSPGVPMLEKIPLPTEQNKEAVISQFIKLARIREVAAFMSEPIFSNAGTRIPPADFYPQIAEICRKHKILLIMDEVATGFGRTGKLFASEHWGLEPDIMCMAKAFSGGYATIGATIVTEEVYENCQHIPSYSTFGWMPNDLALTRANVELVVGSELWRNAAAVGASLLSALKPLEKLSKVKEVRGVGMLFSIELASQDIVEKVLADALEQGLVVDNYPERILFFSPPLIMDENTAMAGAKILTESLTKFCQ